MIETTVNLTIDLTGARGAIIEAEKRFNECAEAREWGEACGHAVDGFVAGKVALNAVIAAPDHQAQRHQRDRELLVELVEAFESLRYFGGQRISKTRAMTALTAARQHLEGEE